MKLGEIIKNCRTEQNITQEALAEFLNVSTQAISKWETNNSYPDITLIPKIAEFFSISIDTLFYESKKMPNEVFKENHKLEEKFLKHGEIDFYITLWKESYIKYPNDFRVAKEYIAAMCLDKNHKYTDKIIDYSINIFRNCKDEDIVQSTELILKTYLYNEYETSHYKASANENSKINIDKDEKILNQYEVDKIYNYTNSNIPAKGKKIIIVDDVAFMRMMLKEILGKQGHTVLKAADGIELLDMLQEETPDYIILDINMPKMNGIDTLLEVKKRYPDIKVVMCSAMSNENTVKKTFDFGADAFVAKPFQAETLVNRII